MAFDPTKLRNFTGLDHDIDKYITGFSRQSYDGKFSPTQHVIKYLPPSRVKLFQQSARPTSSPKRLFAADKPGYTWGDAVYICPLKWPFSGMLYGRAGVVGTVAPQRVYDAVDPQGISYYQQWIQAQSKWYDLLTTTIHEEVANRYLRNRFRTYFQLDCVFFHPDQIAPPYSDRRQDIWFGITHEVNGRVACGLTSAVANPEWCVLLCEEFAASKGKMVYGALLGPERRKGKLQPSIVKSMSPKLEQRIMAAYQQITVGGKLTVVSI